jgi:hypothetical protein
MVKKIFFFLLFIAVVMGTILFFRDAIARFTLNRVLTQTIGAETDIDRVHIGIFDPVVEIKGLKVYNPRGFINETFLEMPQIAAKYDMQALFNQQLHITTLTVALKKLTVAIGENGAINVDKLKIVHPPQNKKGEAGLSKFMIDKFTLQVGVVATKNYARKDNNVAASVDFGMKERMYKDITSFQGLAGLILIDTMKMAGVKGAQVYGAHLLDNLGKNLLKRLDAKEH